MTHGRDGADIFARRDEADWAMFLRASARDTSSADPWRRSVGASSEPQELEPDLARADASADGGSVRHFHARVVGLPYPNADGTSRREAVTRLRRWERVRLRHRPDNPVDANAVEVLRAPDERQLGFLPAPLAAEVVAAARTGTRYLAVVSEVTGPSQDDLLAVAPVRATLVVLALEGGATVAVAREHLLNVIRGA